MMKARSIDRLLNVHAEICDVENGLKHSIDDCPSTRGTRNHEKLAVLGDNGWRHAR